MPRRREIAALATDRDALRVIAGLPDYQPANPAYYVSRLCDLEAALLAAERAEEQARWDYEEAKRRYAWLGSERRKAASAFQIAMRGAKTQIVAQYGDDSYLVQVIGWTRRSARRRPGRRPRAGGGAIVPGSGEKAQR